MRIQLILSTILTLYLAKASKEEDIARAAIEKAVKIVEEVNEKVVETLRDVHTHAQKAEEESIDKQRIGDVMQEATKILIKDHGVDIMKEMEKIDAQAILREISPTITLRKKRQSDDFPLEVDDDCIERPDFCDPAFPFRPISGWCNNLNKPRLGSTLTTLRRYMNETKYDDGFESVRTRSFTGGVLPSARVVSNIIFNQGISKTDPKYNHFLMQFGQWIAHDIIFSPNAVGPNNMELDCSSCSSVNITSNCAPIQVPADDPYFPITAAGRSQNCIRLTRTINGQEGLGPRAPLNQNSHFLDLSPLYGSTDCVSRQIRTLQNGQMKMFRSRGFILPPQDKEDANCQSPSSTPCFLAGDSRNSLHPGLIPLHTIYLKQHNKWAQQFAQKHPNWDDEKIYQETRRLMIAMYQRHVYTEYLPKVIGNQMMGTFRLFTGATVSKTYEPTTNPAISAEFCSGAFRFGHTQVRQDIPRVGNTNRTLGSAVNLGENIFYADSLYERPNSVLAMTQGMVNFPSLATGPPASFAVRNQMFEIRGKPGSGVDLIAVNIQRAREMGVHPYTDVRRRIDGRSINDFKDLSGLIDDSNIELLKRVYTNVNDIDLFVGVNLEKVVDPTSLLGLTGSRIIGEQFNALKRGDRFFFENSDSPRPLTNEEFNLLNSNPLSTLVCTNTDGMESVNVEDIFANGNPSNSLCPSEDSMRVDGLTQDRGRDTNRHGRGRGRCGHGGIFRGGFGRRKNCQNGVEQTDN